MPYFDLTDLLCSAKSCKSTFDGHHVLHNSNHIGLAFSRKAGLVYQEKYPHFAETVLFG